MTTSDLVKELCREQNISIAELARRLGQSRQNLAKKLQRDTLTLSELRQIADVLGVVYEQAFILPSGAQLKLDTRE